MRMRGLVILVAMLGSLSLLPACLCGNKQATAACAKATTGKACEKCCNLHGAFGHSFSTGAPCKCL